MKNTGDYKLSVDVHQQGTIAKINRMRIYDTVKSQQFLMDSNDLITKIELRYPFDCDDEKVKKFGQIIDLILKCSLKSLAEIRFIDFPEGLLKRFSNPLPKIKSVHISNCYLGDNTVLLSEIFPNISDLDLETEFPTESIIQLNSNFPLLTTMKLDIGEGALSEFESFLNFNPQITTLELCSLAYNWESVRLIGQKLQLDKFDLHINRENQPNERFHFKKLKCLTFVSGSYDCFPFSFEQLEHLKLKDVKKTFSADKIEEIIKQNEKLVKVTLIDIEDLILSGELVRISKLSLTFGLFFKLPKRIMLDIIEFLNEKSSAFKVKLKGVQEDERNFLVNKVDKRKWNVASISFNERLRDYAISFKRNI